MVKKNCYIYINNYDDIEFNEKVRKVQDADKHQLHLNDESDLARLEQMRRRNRLSPVHNPNFFSAEKRRFSINEEASQVHEFNFSEHDQEDDENDTASLNETLNATSEKADRDVNNAEATNQ